MFFVSKTDAVLSFFFFFFLVFFRFSSSCRTFICFQVLEPLGILSGEYHIIAASFDNTHGILPEDVMGKINRSMASIGHTIFIGFFDAGAFERGTKEFYGKVFSLFVFLPDDVISTLGRVFFVSVQRD